MPVDEEGLVDRAGDQLKPVSARMVDPELHHHLRLEVYSHLCRDVTRERAVALSNQYNVLPEVLAPTLQFTTRKDENRSNTDRRPGDADNIFQ